LRITDFGIAKLYHEDNSQDTSGTPGYMAPEVMRAQNHSYAVDYFALGVFTYELIMGKVIL
jgi:serine/threonine protein kinase